MPYLSIINGPNLNLLGSREPEIYGDQTFDDFLKQAIVIFPSTDLRYYQSNVEGELVNQIQKDGLDPNCLGIVLNAAAYSHTSIAIADAVAAVKAPVIAVHISNIFARETVRHTDLLAAHCKGIISGLGMDGYLLAIQHLLSQET